MHKKHKIPSNIPQLIPNKKKALLKLCNDPEAIKRIIAMNKAASEVLEKKNTVRSLSVSDWAERAFKILPEEYDKPENLEKLKNLFQDNFTERCIDDSCNERKDSDN